MGNPSQPQTKPEEGGDQNRQQAEPPSLDVAWEREVRSRPKPPDTPNHPEEQANGGAHPRDVKNR